MIQPGRSGGDETTSTSEKAVVRVAEILAGSEAYPWKTARYLSGKLADEGFRISAENLETALLSHAKEPGRKVRYSFFPARKSLDLLWGHIAVVNDADRLPSPHLEKEFGEFEPCNLPGERIWCFLSHSFLDLNRVKVIYDDLRKRGYGVWLAEAEVLTGMMIVKAVQEGLELCDRFVLYASRNSLASRWVLKEGLQAVDRWNRQVTVIADGRDDAVCSLFEDWLENRWDDSLEERVNKLASHDNPPDPAATALSDLLLAGLGALPPDQRVAVLAPFPESKAGTRFRTFDQEFPNLNV
jgi:hypothetical protein